MIPRDIVAFPPAPVVKEGFRDVGPKVFTGFRVYRHGVDRALVGERRSAWNVCAPHCLIDKSPGSKSKEYRDVFMGRLEKPCDTLISQPVPFGSARSLLLGICGRHAKV